jgi:hypothetical protein
VMNGRLPKQTVSHLDPSRPSKPIGADDSQLFASVRLSRSPFPRGLPSPEASLFRSIILKDELRVLR